MEPERRLYRSESDRFVAGVAGGLGEFLGIDPTIVRLLFVLLAFFGGSGIIAYVVMWLLVPTASQVNAPPRQIPRQAVEEAREGAQRGVAGAKAAYQRWRGDAGAEPPDAGQPPPDAGRPRRPDA